MVRFIHAADLHLDSPFSGLKHLPEQIWKAIRESTFISLHRIVDTAIEKKVDFILFSGDVYDVNDRSVKAQAEFKREMERLKQVGVSVYIIHGNHDFVSNHFLHLKLPDNVTTLNTTIETVQMDTRSGERVALSGFSYEKRWVHERMIKDYPKRFPDVDMHIGLLHGFQEGSTNEHANYAPFSISELQEKQYDYWALGHIHKYQRVADFPLTYYPGNSQGRHKNESGDKGFLLVEWDANENKVQFLPSAPIIWEKILIDATKARTLNDVYKLVEKKLPQSTKQSHLVDLRLLFSNELSNSVHKKVRQENFKAAFQQLDEETFTWIVTLSIEVESEKEKTAALEKMFPEAWDQATTKVLQESVFDELTRDFFHQTKQASLLKNQSEPYRKKMMEEAIQKLQSVMELEGEPDDEN